ncbi:YdeI/OmpD-associated family protein [Olivibacter domesticus]|uniref:Bacteriocin-protection, YdeI or OmpD-Associated n=1 Tax=Olivibacter domesticus TaxID=407022 RepID=A0A1H7MAJ9_OLID1|nr:YdeI/OmpD-associated family protein [Olivibacter domesticus]SEL08151.1 Bacteriocin-protection, YdeI or OmpD-Associated [Olivibacter domesticus]
MITFSAEILKFGNKGEKSGWSYIEIPKDLAGQIKPDYRKSFRVKGKIDQEEVKGLALTPMGEGDFILALKATLRKKIKKEEGAQVAVMLEEDKDFKIEMPEDLEICLGEEVIWMERFLALAKSHQHYFINWINQAKAEETRAKRIALTLEAMEKQLNFGAMIRMDKARRGI